MKNDRNSILDFLRGTAILVMIFLHSTSYHLSDKTAYFLWNWGNFVVQIIVFVSAYLFFKKVQSFATTDWVSFFVKRLTRLLIPYYLFLIVLFVILMIFKPAQLTVSYVIQSILIVGGIDLSWLVLLFVYLTIATPFMYYALTRNSFVFHLITLGTLLSALYFLFTKSAVTYKLTMWAPWLFMFNLTYYFVWVESKIKTKAPIILFLLGLTAFVGSFLILKNNHLSTAIFSNKYPPNLYVISYGMIWIGFLYFIYNTYLIRNTYINAVTAYFSTHSYTLYFIHSLVILALTIFNFHKMLYWPIFFPVVLAFSFLMQEALGVFRKRSLV